MPEPAKRARTPDVSSPTATIRPSKKKRQQQAQADAPTFRGIAEDYVAKLTRKNRSEATLAKTEWLLSFARAEFGDVPIREIAAPTILKVLQALEIRERYESARRLRSTIGSVFRFATAAARADADPTYALRGALTQVKPTPRAAITDAEQFGALLRAIDAFDGQPGTRIALRLLALLSPVLESCGWPNGPSSTLNVPYMDRSYFADEDAPAASSAAADAGVRAPRRASCNLKGRPAVSGHSLSVPSNFRWDVERGPPASWLRERRGDRARLSRDRIEPAQRMWKVAS